MGSREGNTHEEGLRKRRTTIDHVAELISFTKTCFRTIFHSLCDGDEGYNSKTSSLGLCEVSLPEREWLRDLYLAVCRSVELPTCPALPICKALVKSICYATSPINIPSFGTVSIPLTRSSSVRPPSAQDRVVAWLSSTLRLPIHAKVISIQELLSRFHDLPVRSTVQDLYVSTPRLASSKVHSKKPIV